MKASYKAAGFLVFSCLLLLFLSWNESLPSVTAQEGVEVNSADPPEAEQGTINLDVLIKGGGFKKGAKARFLLPDTENPGGILVKSTKFKGPTQLIANIDIAEDATVSKFDIEVKLPDGRTGKGTELFSVTEKSSGKPCEISTPQFPPGFSLVTELNPTAEFGPDFGRVIDVGLVDLDEDPGHDAIVVAVGPRTGGTVEVFLLDPATGELLDHPHITLTPEPPDEGFGEPFMGDVNADGVPDIAAGPTEHQNMYVFFGSVSAEGVLRYDDRTHFPVIFTEESARRGGRAIGDVTGDGYGDVIVGDPRADVAKQRNAGRVLVYEFNPDPPPSFKPFREITNSTPNRNEVFGVSVAVGDVMGTLDDDLVIGAQGVNVGKEREAGMVFVFPGPLPLSLPPVELTTGKKGDKMGSRVTTGNVMNGDSYSDVIAVGYLKPPTVVFYGAVLDGQNPDITLVADPGLDGGYGTNIAAGDLNGDGLADVLVGAPNITEGTGMCTTGGSYVYLSSYGGPLSSNLLRPPYLEGSGLYGWSVAPAPGTRIFLVSELRDVDGDGTIDGQVYVYRYKKVD